MNMMITGLHIKGGLYLNHLVEIFCVCVKVKICIISKPAHAICEPKHYHSSHVGLSCQSNNALTGL